MLLATLLLLARLIAPAAAMPTPAEQIDQIALQSLCHGAPSDDRDPAPAHHDCLLCPACQLFAQVAIPAPAGPALGIPTRSLIGPAATTPASTGPPTRKRDAAPPTGPPAPFI